LFWRLIYFKSQVADTIPVLCGTASFYARKTADFPGLKGKESSKKWQRSFFYVKNLKEGADACGTVNVHHPVGNPKRKV
jgi:hypothetical protein